MSLTLVILFSAVTTFCYSDILTSNCLGDRWSRFQALKDPCCAQVRCSRAHRDGAEAEGELEEVLQEQKVQAPRPEAQEDPCHQEGAHPPREGTQDRQGAPS